MRFGFHLSPLTGMLLDRSNRRIYFLIPYPPGSAPGQRFRFEQYLGLLAANGNSIKLFPFLTTETYKILYRPGNYYQKIAGVLRGFMKRLISLPQLLQGHFIFVFREATPIGPPFMEWLIARLFRKKIIYDFDDAIWMPNTSVENRIISRLKWHSKVKSICRWSYRVSCGNEFLAGFARELNGSVVVNPTTIDTEKQHNPSLYPPGKESQTFKAGWTGTHSTLFYLNPLLPVFESLHKKYPQFRIVIIADRKPNWNLPCLEFIQWDKSTEVEDLLKFDIGIMPLTEDPWSMGKCGFKALQYMSLEIPALVSPVGINAKIVDHGIHGFHCASMEEWYQYIEYLIVNKNECPRLGKRGREKVIAHYSVGSNAATFLALFE